jgi:hypothetical protein
MNAFAGGFRFPSERLIASTVATIFVAASLTLMLSCASPELSWDEADYAASTPGSWSYLWSRSDYTRHWHGPMSIYLSKLGEVGLSSTEVSPEARLRFFPALAGSLAIGGLFLALRHCFHTSWEAALAGSWLLLFSVIRLEETGIIGPHHLMLACTLGVAALGYRWRDKPTAWAAAGLGMVMGWGAVSMTYVVPTAVCWAVSVGAAGREWFAWDRTHFKVSRSVLTAVATTIAAVLVLWPPGVLHRAVLSDFRFYLHYPNLATLVGNRVFEVAPRTSTFYWLAHLDAPILAFSAFIVLTAVWKAFRSGRFSAKHKYLLICSGFYAVTMVAAHIAGARNLLQFIGILCVATGALIDEALGADRLMVRLCLAAVMILAPLNLVWLSRDSRYTPEPATDGYRAFVKENANRLAEPSAALVLAPPILKFYARQSGTPVAWNVHQMPWTTRADAPLSDDVRYVLINSLVYDDMPRDQPMRRVVANRWKLVWAFSGRHVWGLRLYENPRAPRPSGPACPVRQADCP